MIPLDKLYNITPGSRSHFFS